MKPALLSTTFKTSTDNKGPILKLLKWLPIGKVPEMSAEQLHQRLATVQIVDVRSHREFSRGHIVSANHLPITDFSKQAIDALQLDSSRPVVTICRSAHRSIPATRHLVEMGFNASQLAGGMKEWWARALPMVKPDSES